MKRILMLLERVQSCIPAKLSNKKGATMVEYALMVSLIAVACILGVTAVGTKAQSSFNGISTKIVTP